MSRPNKKKGAKQQKGASKVDRTALDRQIEGLLNFRLNELAAHSSSCWTFALKEFDRVGRGVIYWQFKSLEDAKIKLDQPVVYRSEAKVLEMEYEPAAKFTRLYVPNKACVALVAINTGDERDALMKTMVLERYTQDEVRLRGYVPSTPTLKFKVGSNDVAIGDGVRFCSNPLCYALEKEQDAFKKCDRCKFRPYCSRECQVMHWRSLHKGLCASEAQLTEYFDKRPALTDLQKLEEERLRELAAKTAELKALAAAVAPTATNTTIEIDAAGQPTIKVQEGDVKGQ